MTSVRTRSGVLQFVCRTALACVQASTLLAAAALHADPGHAPAALVAQSRLNTGAVVEGILGYTTWPKARDTLNICVSGSGADAMDVKSQLSRSRGSRTLLVTPIEADQLPPADCDAIYFDGWTPVSQSAVLRSVAQKPVLTIGRGGEFCSDGGIFCLKPEADGTRFEVSLDALARSGLHVHPQVLWLAHPKKGGSS